MCLALGVERLDDAAAKLGRHARHAAAAGNRREGEGPAQAEVGRGLDAEDGLEGAVSRGRAPRRRHRSRPAADPALLARRSRTFHHAARGDHEGPEDRHPQRRHVPDAGDRPGLDVHALADAQGRTGGSARLRGRADPRRGRDRARSRDRLLRERAAPAPPRRAHARGLPARRAGRARPLQDDRPRGARKRRDRPRGTCLKRRRGHRGPVRRPHRLLLARENRSRSSASRR